MSPSGKLRVRSRQVRPVTRRSRSKRRAAAGRRVANPLPPVAATRRAPGAALRSSLPAATRAPAPAATNGANSRAGATRASRDGRGEAGEACAIGRGSWNLLRTTTPTSAQCPGQVRSPDLPTAAASATGISSACPTAVFACRPCGGCPTLLARVPGSGIAGGAVRPVVTSARIS